MNQLGFSFGAADEPSGPQPEKERKPEAEPGAARKPEPATHRAVTPAPKPAPSVSRVITGLAEIDSSTGPVERCSLDSCNEHAARWVVFDHAPVFTAFCNDHAPESPWWTSANHEQN